MDVLAQVVAAGYPHIATQDSGVSWGALIAIISALVTGGGIVAGILWRAISAQLAKIEASIEGLRKEQATNHAKLDEKVEKVEANAREARANQWQEHNILRDRVTKTEAKAEAAAALSFKATE